MTPRPARAFAYHSAHAKPSNAVPCDGWSGVGGTAVVHDVTTGPLPPQFDAADVLYADIPWRAGYGAFQDRAGVEGDANYRDFLAAVDGIANGDARPAVLVVGAHAVRYFNGYQAAQRVRMPAHGDLDGTALFWRCQPDGDTTVTGLLDRLATEYRTVGDFCAGYGLAGWTFRRHGGRFVLSDINRQCIGHIAEHASDWRPELVTA